MERIESVRTYYTCLESMKRKFDKYARKQPLRAESLEDYNEWAKDARHQLWNLLGLDKMEDCDLKPKLLESVTITGRLRREKILIQVEPGVFMPFYMIYPRQEDQKYIGTSTNRKPACMIALHGHQGGGKESLAGRREIPAIDGAIIKYNYDYGLTLAEKGYITIIPDARGYGERRELAFQKEEEASYLGGTCYHLSHMAGPLGMTVMGMLVWDLMRLIDYIYDRDDLDVTNLACVGFSGGGMQTLMGAAVDERIQTMIISGYMYGVKDSLLLLNGNCNCNYVPQLWEYFDMGDIGALLAPRRVILQSCKEDHLNGPRGLDNVYEQIEIMKQAYKVCNASDMLSHDIREGGHRFHSQVFSMLMP